MTYWYMEATNDNTHYQSFTLASIGEHFPIVQAKRMLDEKFGRQRHSISIVIQISREEGLELKKMYNNPT